MIEVNNTILGVWTVDPAVETDGRQAERPLQGPKMLHPVQPGRRMTGSYDSIGLSADTIATCSGMQIADAEVSRIPRFISLTRSTAATAEEGRVVVSNSCNTLTIEVIELKMVYCG